MVRHAAVILATGGSLGFGLNLGHEMGHKKTTLERWLAKITLALGCYGHFFVEHNRGHHRDVATPKTRPPRAWARVSTALSFVRCPRLLPRLGSGAQTP
ncbi:fatty acid desaturase [Halopseudomonas pachastrellae]|nr:fatty acid desaturase [Halopseudomonas pachastrellae]